MIDTNGLCIQQRKIRPTKENEQKKPNLLVQKIAWTESYGEKQNFRIKNAWMDPFLLLFLLCIFFLQYNVNNHIHKEFCLSFPQPFISWDVLQHIRTTKHARVRDEHKRSANNKIRLE